MVVYLNRVPDQTSCQILVALPETLNAVKYLKQEKISNIEYSIWGSFFSPYQTKDFIVNGD